MVSIAMNMALLILRTVSPVVVLLAALSLIFAKVAPPASPSPITSVVVASVVPRRAAILALLSIAALTFLGDGLTFVIYAVLHKQWPLYTGIETGAVIGILAFSGLAVVGAWKDVAGVNVWSRKRVKAAIALSLALDVAQVVIYGMHTKHLNSQPHIPENRFGVPIPALLHLVFPTLRVLVVLPLLAALLAPRVVYTPVQIADDDVIAQPTASTFLLPPSTGLSPIAGHSDQAKYGTFRSNASTNSGTHTRSPTPAPSTAPKADEKPAVDLDPSWAEIGRRLRRLTPYLWPSKSRALQGLAVLCIVLVLIGRAINVLIPLTFGKIISVFDEGKGESPWPYLFFYVALRFLGGGGGLGSLRDSLWAPVMQYSDREMSALSFDHLLNLSFSFHTHRKTGEILRVLDRGAAINHTLELILFNIIPTFVDILVALVAFIIIFDWTLALVIFVVMFLFVAASVILTRWRTKIRRQMNERDVVTRGIHTDCLLNYETVKYFGGEQHESERYRAAMSEYQALEYQVIISLNLLNLVQNAIITTGLLVGSMLVAARVVRGESPASHFVIFISYLAQLYMPLYQLGYMYRSVNQSLIDTEKLLKLLNEPTEINDKPNAPDLIVNDGEIEFENVSFSYDARSTALHGVSFKVPKGAQVALVGESGAGKSTILRLLYRFYDLAEGEGRILIDGQDIRDVTQASLRKAIGVVPQDSVLFNSSISYNIGYGKLGSTAEEIEEAAKSAQMHDRILSFPDGYQTLVGERGVRLSGGEKQRVAIARTLLKNPPILLLDEATSALDTSTEKDIQKALQNLVKGRSSLSIAHRLSTIASADIILVIKDGQVIEQGNHEELLALGGVFATMWADQISTTGVESTRTATSEEPETYNNETPVGFTSYAAAANPEVPQDMAPAAEAEDKNETPIGFNSYAAAANPEVAHREPSVKTKDVSVRAPSPEPTPAVEEQKPETPAAAVDLTDDKPSPPLVAAPVAFPSSADDEPSTYFSSPVESPAPTSPASPLAFPASPLAFPTSDDTASQTAPSVASSPPVVSPGVKFGAEVAGDRTGTPDPEAEPKRKRISSQNFQRLARRISLTTRRQGSTSSSIIAGLTGRRDSVNLTKDDDSVARASGEGAAASGSGPTAANDSPAGSIAGEDKAKKQKKKDKKLKKAST